MKKILIGLNHFLLMFGASVYMGLWWALHIIWYPSWRAVRRDNVAEHFINPIDQAIQFFTILVSIMLITNIVLIIVEWKTKFRWLGIATLLMLILVTYMFKSEILPVINEIRAGLPSDAALKVKMEEWMHLNDIRWIYYSAIWSLLMIYFLIKKLN
jgi:hypothetical protein